MSEKLNISFVEVVKALESFEKSLLKVANTGFFAENLQNLTI
jgi:hypothetical protein